METEQTKPEEALNEESIKQQEKKRELDWGMICVIAAALLLVLTVIFACVTIGTAPKTDDIETTVCTAAPVTEQPTQAETTCSTEPSIDILPDPTETIHIEETKPAKPTKPSSDTKPEAPSTPTTNETTSDVDPDDLEMLAIIIYQEAGGNKSCDDCRRYVADIVLNRVADPRFPNTIEGVLTQKKQYGRLYWTGIKWPKRAKYDTEKAAVERAYRIAEEVLNGQHSKVYGEGYIWQAGFKQGKSGFWCCGHYYGRS